MKKKLYHQFACSCLMLPEHRARLEQRRRKSASEAERCRPILDEQQQEQFQRLAEQSMHSGLRLKAIYTGCGGRRTFTGVIVGLQEAAGKIRFQPEDGGPAITLAVAGIVHLEAASPPGFS